MTGGRGKLTGLVADANVLIDYAEADKSVLTLISRHLARLHVASPVLGEVRGLSEGEADRLGIGVVEPTLEQALRAEVGEGPTSFNDRLCLVIAHDEGYSILTNDKALRVACDNCGIACVWGMEAMARLVKGGHLSASRAMAAAEKIARANRFITQAILDRFRNSIRP